MTGEGNAQDKISDHDGKAASEGRGKGLFGLVVKILIVVAVLGVAFYFIYFNRVFQDAFFVVSSIEINSPRDKIVKKYSPGDRVYFLLTAKKKALNGNLVVLEIDFHDGSDYQSYKKVTYEIDTDFQRLGAYLPGEYFRRAGKYLIRASIDGKGVTSHKITVE